MKMVWRLQREIMQAPGKPQLLLKPGMQKSGRGCPRVFLPPHLVPAALCQPGGRRG